MNDGEQKVNLNGAHSELEDFSAHLLRRLRRGQLKQYKIASWCSQTGLVAWPAPHPRQEQPIASTSVMPPSTASASPAVCMTLPPLSNDTEEILSHSSVTLTLPESPSTGIRGSGHEHIARLDFAPDGNHLAVFTSFCSDTAPEQSHIRLVLFQKGDEINSWMCIFDWDAKRAKANLANQNKTEADKLRLDEGGIIDVRWLEGSSLGSTPPGKGGKRRYDALLDYGGTVSLAAVLESSETVVLHMPQAAMQPQLFVLPLESASSTSRDLSLHGTSYSPLPMNTAGDGNMLGMDGMGMPVTGTTPIDPLQKAMNNPTPGSSLQAMLQNVKDPEILAQYSMPPVLNTPAAIPTERTRIASIGSCTTVQQPRTLTDGPTGVLTNFLVAYQNVRQPMLKRDSPTQVNGPGQQSASYGGDKNGFDGPATAAATEGQQSSKTEQNLDGASDATTTLPKTQSDPTGLGIGTFSMQPSFDNGYGDINMSALDDLFDTDFGGNTGDSFDPSKASLASTLDSFNENFASAFPSATEPNGAASPTKKDTGSLGQENAGTDSPSKSIGEGTAGHAESRSNSPRKSAVNGVEDEDECLLPKKLLPTQLEDDHERLSEVVISSIALDWTEYGVLSVSLTHATAITAMTAVLSSQAGLPHSTVTHCQFLGSGAQEASDGQTLLVVSQAVADGNASSQLALYTIKQETFELSEAFGNLDGRKADPSPDWFDHREEWAVQLFQSSTSPPGTRILHISEDSEKYIAVVLRDGQMQYATLDELVQSSTLEKRVYLTLWLSRTIDLTSLRTIRTFPSYYPFSIEHSPSTTCALVCALQEADESQVVGLPAYLDLSENAQSQPRTIVKKEDGAAQQGGTTSNMANKLFSRIRTRQSTSDIVGAARRLKQEQRQALINDTWLCALQQLESIRVEQTWLLWPLLSIQQQLLGTSQRQVIDDIIQLATCQRILQDNKSTPRSAATTSSQQTQMADTFEADSIWPIIGHIAWVFDLWDRIILRMTSDNLSQNWSSSSFLIIHPLPRIIQQRLVRLIARFANFVMNLSDGQNINEGTVQDADTAALEHEVAKNVLGDLIVSNRIKTQEWSGMLHGLATKLGTEWADGSPKARRALMSGQLPPEAEKTAREISRGVREKLLHLVTSSSAGGLEDEQTKRERDIVTLAPVQITGQQIKVCTSCAGKTAALHNDSESEWQASKRRTCICGGTWLAV